MKLLETDYKEPIQSAAEQLKVFNEFFRCEEVHNFFKALDEDDEDFFQRVLFAGAPADNNMLAREQLIGQAKERETFRIALLGLRDIVLTKLNQKDEE
jgi:hypothetical protein